MLSSRKYNFPEGEILLIDKPASWTSFDVVNKIRYMIKHHLGIRKIKVGHAGTLDPLATGLLIVCTGKATKQISGLTGMDKEYTGTFYLGATTPSYDRETAIDQTYNIDHISANLIQDTAKKFVGSIEQIPPAFSAVRIDGTRAYKKARKQEDVKLSPRQVDIYEFEITRTGVPETSFRVLCSKGTYIRSLAYDFGKSLNSGAYLYSLCRTRIGNFSIEDAISIQDLGKEMILMQQNS
ncbi:MAG: tRNA pseudouridine(55) synthase TruB [Bacteroidales bacterium]|nr:tRNA pseudouridine(55) synthase TruB [Bacteroidales bacterium]